MRVARRSALAVALAVTAFTAPSCSPRSDAREPLTVLAASSLTDVFTRVGKTFTEKRGVPVRFSFGPSSALVRQVREGGVADVVATADEETMARAARTGEVEAPVVFARNELHIAVAPGNPKRIRGVADLARRDLIVVVCAADVPCGRLAQGAFRQARVRVEPRSYEPDVAATLAKVRAGEADAGLVYKTGVQAARGAVSGVSLGRGIRATAPDLVAVTRQTELRAAAEAFVGFLRLPIAQSMLREAGFGAP